MTTDGSRRVGEWGERSFETSFHKLLKRRWRSNDRGVDVRNDDDTDDEYDDENSDDDGNYDDENVCIDVIKNTLMIEMSGGGKTKATTQQTET